MKEYVDHLDEVYAMDKLFKKLPFWLQVSLGSVISAIVAFYIPLIAVLVTGVWLNRLTMWLDVFVECSMLLVITLIGYRKRRIWKVTLTFVVLYLVYDVQHFVRSVAKLQPFLVGAELFHPVAALLVNGYLINKLYNYLNSN